MHVIGIDWSGSSQHGGRKTIWFAEASHSHLRRLENGRTRDEIADHLIELADEDPNLVVGFDFAFSMPAWFVHEQGAETGPEFWDVAAGEGERWLSECPAPFYGLKGTRRTADAEQRRRTESEVPAIEGRTPKSVFQIAGGGHVGRGSIRGMRILKRLAEAGFRIWPFQEPEPAVPLVVEIYPRLLTGPVVKGDRSARESVLLNYPNQIGKNLREVAAWEEDQFDAAVSAVVMNRYLHELVVLAPPDDIDRVEGRIWHPLDSSFRPGAAPTDYLTPNLPSEPFVFIYESSGLDDGPFNPELAEVVQWPAGADGTVVLPTAGTPRYLRVLQRDGDRIFTADGEWIRLVSVSQLRRKRALGAH